MKRIIFTISMFCCLSGCKKDEPSPIACFKATCDSKNGVYSARVAENIIFQNCSSDATQYLWNFGDNTSNSNKNSNHTYKKGGTYTVTLEASSDKNTQRISHDIEILSADGEWDGYLKIGNTVVRIMLTLQQVSNSLTGNFDLTDGSAHATIQSSTIKNNDVVINFSCKNGDETFQFKLKGIINSGFSRINGDLSIEDEICGSWNINRNNDKSEGINSPCNTATCKNDLYTIIKSINKKR